MWDKIIYSFPVQLLFLHLRKNLLLLVTWGLLVLIIFQSFGTVLGIPFLFLDPEYLNRVSWRSFFLVGIALAIFTMAFHMTTYILDGPRFKFLAIIPRPFLQYCLNNSIIPLSFYLLYLYAFIAFQLDNEHENNRIIWEYFLGFSAGSIITYTLLFVYFGFTNKDFFVLFAGTVEKQLRKTKISRANMLKRIKESKRAKYKVLDYLDISFRFKLVRQDLSGFEGQQLLRVFDQNHLNMIIIQTALISLILLMGIFRETPFLQLPAAASGILLLAIATMLVGAVSFWLRDWGTPAVLAFILVFNSLSNTTWFNRPHEAFGLDYDTEPASYNLEKLNAILHPDTVKADREYTLQILENWKAKFPEGSKPKMVFITVSGGGQRAALWSLKVLQDAHFVTGNRLFEHTQLITGASGGLIGAAVFREIYLQSLDDPSISVKDERYLDQISSDNLNPIIFTLLVNDLLFRNQYFDYNGRRYLKDRGYAFENQLNINMQGILDKPLSAYREPEFRSLIPMLPVTPLVTNDGRKLYIAPYPISYFGVSNKRVEGLNEKSQGIDFQRFYSRHDALSLRFITALRMGATFPFITPNIQLPSKPQMETMDAGLSDNFGMQDALKFIDVFEDWIRDNTSGVLLLTIRDSEKFSDIDQKYPPTLLEKFFTPLKNIYINWDNVQTLHNEVLFTRIKESVDFPMERIEFEYSTLQYLRERGLADEEGVFNQLEQEIQRASLNWRLTAREKKSIIDNIASPINRKSLNRLKEYQFLE
ncbi:patatin-like phospholipase family protein [Cecembia lonarensis]|uniref:Patatin-like phospholipase n=1 Tax=Cecembia lonarensis (strain CCUG 58316 / KCTC 22772 / LW9) TaxID=1225176 RepID=K1KZE7_CECL9|nr:patatin-like phospholipase family protein [Cecembia lonarensis]EKB49555.1 Patatin-like phospholipase [Cecembia lonarensis LW9]